MAHVGGPTSGLPGRVSTPPKGQCCDEHPGVPAFKRVQGETDAWGAEYLDMCVTCYDKYKTELESADNSGVCDICGTSSDNIIRRRDPSEGTCGRIYNTCSKCSSDLSNNF